MFIWRPSTTKICGELSIESDGSFPPHAAKKLPVSNRPVGALKWFASIFPFMHCPDELDGGVLADILFG